MYTYIYESYVRFQSSWQQGLFRARECARVCWCSVVGTCDVSVRQVQECLGSHILVVFIYEVGIMYLDILSTYA